MQTVILSLCYIAKNGHLHLVTIIMKNDVVIPVSIMALSGFIDNHGLHIVFLSGVVKKLN